MRWLISSRLASFSRSRLPSSLIIAAVSMSTGYVIGVASRRHEAEDQKRVLPSGLPRTCCDDDDDDLTNEQRALPGRLARIVGNENVKDGKLTPETAPFLTGARIGGGGQALAIVTPRMLKDVVDCVQEIVDANCVILVQGSNTGLTGGSVPRSNSERPVVIVSMKNLDTIFPIDNGKRVVCLAGAGLATLSRKLAVWFPDRESHSVLGSTFLNPTTAAGVAFGSGGTQLRKGPAYTDRALYLKVWRNKFGENKVDVVNTLGIAGIEDHDFHENTGNVIQQLDLYQNDIRQGYTRAMAYSSQSPSGKAKASDATDYAERVCQLDHSVSRYNASCHGCDCNRSEGKVLILATVHDTFARPLSTRHFWISFRDLDTALAFRREVCLDNPQDLPISLEYLDRDSFDVIDRSGRVMATLIKLVGPSSAILRTLWNAKLWVEGLPFPGAPLWGDALLHRLNPIFPATLPRRMMESGRSLDHHVQMTVGEFGSGSMDRLLDRLHSFALSRKVVIHPCHTASEAASLTAFRFVAAPAFRTWCVGEGYQGVSVDYALPKNAGDIPTISSFKPVKRMRYSHFGCNVVHEDLAFERNVDIHEAKMELKSTVEHKCGGRLPAEHGHGTEYNAPQETLVRWQNMDPLNVMNPGIGGLSSKYKYRS